jgi:hypothetical protein
MSILLFHVRCDFVFPEQNGLLEKGLSPAAVSSCVDMGVQGKEIFPAQTVSFAVEPPAPQDFEDGLELFRICDHGFGIVELMAFESFADR